MTAPSNRLPQRGEAEIASAQREQFRVGGMRWQQSPHPKCLAADASRHFDLPALGEVISEACRPKSCNGPIRAGGNEDVFKFVDAGDLARRNHRCRVELIDDGGTSET